jgi:hypothetical protein
VDFNAEEEHLQADGDLVNEGQWMPDAMHPEERPLLFVDINLGEDQIERIVVYEGNTAAEMATEFSKKHGMYFQIIKKLINIYI